MKTRLTASCAAFALMTISTLPAAEAPDYNFEVRPILSKTCFHCHGPDEHSREADLRLDTYEGAIEDRKGSRAIDPSNLAKSLFIDRITTDDPDDVMPPTDSLHKLKPEEVDVLVRWVKAGAPYQEHWAFVPPKKTSVPAVDRGYKDWQSSPIDAFVLQRMRDEGLRPMPEAKRTELIRRVTFDLTGLPPTIEEVDAFLADSSDGAYERLVDRLLESPHFGERMSLSWMDAARYGDSSVMHADGPRTMWPWRDWVIKSYNNNKPFNEFSIEQLAGDLLPDATLDQKVASGFNRHHATSDEGGAFPEELRVEYIVDRVKTTGNVWLGLSMECAQCHDHKFDPISMADYYSFFAFFNNNEDPGMQTRRGNQKPLVIVPYEARKNAVGEIEKRRDALDDELAAIKSDAESDIQAWIKAEHEKLTAQNESGVGSEGLAHYFPLNGERDDPVKDQITEEVSIISAGSFGNPNIADRNGDRAKHFSNKTVYEFKQAGSQIDGDTPFSISLWMKVRHKFQGAAISRMRPDETYKGFDLWYEKGHVGVHLVNKWPAKAIKVLSKKKSANFKWENVTVTYDGSGKAAGVKIYFDGKPQETVVKNDTLEGSIVSDTPLVLGGRNGDDHVVAFLDDFRIYTRALEQEDIQAVVDKGKPATKYLTKGPELLSDEEYDHLALTYLAKQHDGYKAFSDKEARLKKDEAEVNNKYPEITSMIMGDNDPSKMRKTYMLNRGQYDQPMEDKEVTAAVPTFLPEPGEGLSANRLGLAKWLFQEDHPLTARVAVNRYWTILFGNGIVETAMDFGNQGAKPSHPELLDWLAVDFMKSGWDIKRMIRLMVTSQTYRQSAVIKKETLAMDPRNVLLARGARFRLQGEFIRDNALAVSGLLVPTIGGESVKPYQPNGIWNEVSLNKGVRYKQDKGEKLFRRSMYTYWKRSAPAPNMMIFDAPTREKCVVKRPRTNTPLQALVTLNNIHFVEASRKLAERMLLAGGKDFDERVNFAYRLCTSREVTAEELAVIKEVYEHQLASFKADPAAAEKYLTTGESPREKTLDVAEHAAYTVIANMILNLDEVLMRG